MRLADAAAALARSRATRFAKSDPPTDAYRLFNGVACGAEGLIVERLGPVLIAQLHDGRLRIDEHCVAAVLRRLFDESGAGALYRKLFPRRRAVGFPDLGRVHTDPQPWLGRPVGPEIEVREYGTRFLIRPYDGYSTGLFLDQRDNRRRIQGLAAGRRVLNLFAYTCSFSVAAGLGGAAEVTSVDISKKFLEWGRANLAANGLPLESQRFICSDVFEYFKRAARQGRRFDTVIIDPPTFSRVKGARRPFSVEADLKRLVAAAVSLLDPGGLALLCTNHRETTSRELERLLRAAAVERGVEILERPALPEDFSDDPGHACSVLGRLG